MNRRALIRNLTLLPLVLALRPVLAGVRTDSDIERLQDEWTLLLPEGFTPPDPSDALHLTEDQWRQKLSTMAFHVLREEGTERRFTSPLDGEHRDGVFLCAGCDLPLFTSAMKYDSGTGWPSFFTHIPGAMGTRMDFKLFGPRTEYHCVRCGGHQGHVFNDGPAPTHERWCNNGVALRFLPADSRGTD